MRMNKWVGIGRVTKDLELKKTNNGKSFLNFTIAINRPFKNAQGENDADFINCQVWDKQAENMVTYVGKGSLIGVEGRIQTRNYDNDEGKKVFITEIVCDRVEFLNYSNASEKVHDRIKQAKNDAIIDIITEKVGDINDELPF